MSPRLKNLLLFFLKIGAAVGLLAWMGFSGKLDFAQLRILIDRSDIFMVNLLVWLSAPILIGTIRWRLLMRGMNIHVPLLRCLQLQMIGFFFNSAMPGAVGGDIIKAVYVLREQKSHSRAPATMSILLDRIVGLFGLFTMGGVCLMFGWRDLGSNPKIHSLVACIVAFLVLMAVFMGLVFSPHDDEKDYFLRFLNAKVPGMGVLRKLYVSLRQYRHAPRYIIIPWVLSILGQLINLIYFLIIANIYAGGEIHYMAISSIYPLGILTTALPLTPGGLGVGHLAFDSLFNMIGLTGGATVFNIVCLGQLALNLLGAIPYMFSRAKNPEAWQEMNAAES